MNILFITAEFPYPPNSGGRIYTWQRIKYLSKNNNIFLYTLINDDDLKYLESYEIKNTLKEVHTYRRKNKLIQAIKGIKYPFSVATRKNIDMFNDISKIIEIGKIDFIIIDHPQMLVNCDFNNNIPKMLTQHNIEYSAFESMYKNSKNLLYRTVYKREYRLMKKFEEYYYEKNLISAYSFISEEDKLFFENNYSNYNINTILIPPGIDNIKGNYEQIKGHNIIFTGKMDYEPNVQAMEWFCNEVLPDIQKEIYDVKLYIVGKNPTDYIKSLSSDSIIVTGKVDSVEEYLKLANIVVIPLLSGGGVKIKLIEALQFKNIVVTTSKGVEGTKFRHNEELLVSDNSNEFAQYCIDILSNPEKYENYIKKSVECLDSNYLWSSIGNQYEQYILSLR